MKITSIQDNQFPEGVPIIEIGMGSGFYLEHGAEKLCVKFVADAAQGGGNFIQRVLDSGGCDVQLIARKEVTTPVDSSVSLTPSTDTKPSEEDESNKIYRYRDLRALRYKTGMNYIDWSKKLGISKSLLSHIENGRACMKFDTFRKIEQRLGIRLHPEMISRDRPGVSGYPITRTLYNEVMLRGKK